jgi:hypothetical protein
MGATAKSLLAFARTLAPTMPVATSNLGREVHAKEYNPAELNYFGRDSLSVGESSSGAA